jgi:type II secretory pathway pseudopilin PulG
MGECDFGGAAMGRRRAFTLVELGVVLAVVVVLLVLALLPAFTKAGISSRQRKDATQVRGIHQAFVMWAQNNRDEYPLPSKVDIENTTVAEEGRAKDTTANIMSMMVFNGLFTPDILVWQAEVNRSIRVHKNYEFDRPRSAVRPADALWDPGLRADFTGQGGGHISYAHLLPAEHRLAKWGNTFIATEPVVGTRGPEITAARRLGNGAVAPTFAKARSNTFLLQGTKDRWKGNIAFNDNHVEFLFELSNGTYTNAAGQETADLIHYDEPDDPSELNHFLGIFIRAGEKRSEFKAIWD